MRPTYPLISCICVTYNRPEMLKKAILCFEGQNYPNKELVVSYPKSDEESRSIVDNFSQHPDIQILRMERDDKESVGNARNIAIAKSRGDYICVWDDDDWYHSSRLSFQFNSMQTTGKGFNASVLTRLILFDTTTQKAYLSFRYTWENTLLCRKEIILQNQYSHVNKGEDTHIVKFLESKRFLHHIEDAPFLYIYVYHGENTWDYEHYEYLINKSEPLDEDVANTILDVLI